MTSGYNPKFDIDLAYGHDGERLVEELLNGSKTVEVKRKRRVDDRFYVETWQRPRGGPEKKSGLNVTTADYWAFAIADSGLVLLTPVRLLKLVARDAKEVQEKDGDNPTRGRLISFASLLRAAESRCACGAEAGKSFCSKCAPF